MKDSILFSIIVPVYNAGRYLEELIESIRIQTYDNWELILVDDGSTDDSFEVCQKSSNDKISAYHIDNSGMMMAVYYGISKSTGEYIIVADADDKMRPNCLETIRNIVCKFNCEMVVYGFRTFGDDSYESRISLKSGYIYGKEELIKAITANEYYALWNKAMKGDIVRDNCKCNLGKISMNNDIAMIFPILTNIQSGFVLDDILYEYRLYKSSVSHNITCTKVIDAGRTIGFAEDVLIQAGLLYDDIEESLYRTYAKQVYELFELVECGRNTLEDFNPIRTQRVYQKFVKYETGREIGFKRALLLRLFRKQNNNLINILLRINRSKKNISAAIHVRDRLFGLNGVKRELNTYIAKKTAIGRKGKYYKYRRDKLAKKYGVEIGVRAEIKGPIDFPHPHGIVIGEGVKIGKNLKVFNNVTIGQNHGGYPTLGDNVTIYPGAVVVGDIHIGNNATIGANSFVNKNVDDGSTVAGNPAKVIYNRQ